MKPCLWGESIAAGIDSRTYTNVHTRWKGSARSVQLDWVTLIDIKNLTQRDQKLSHVKPNCWLRWRCKHWLRILDAFSVTCTNPNVSQIVRAPHLDHPVWYRPDVRKSGQDKRIYRRSNKCNARQESQQLWTWEEGNADFCSLRLEGKFEFEKPWQSSRKPTELFLMHITEVLVHSKTKKMMNHSLNQPK